MVKPVLFVSGLGDSLERAENLKCLYDAYDGEKRFAHLGTKDYRNEAYSGKYGLIVNDIFPTEAPVQTIMVWHAIQGGKYIGLDERGTYYRKEYAKYMDCIVAAGTGGIDMFHQCTGLTRNRIYALGMPRTDRYINKKKGDGHTVLADKKAYLYVPTFRNMRETPMPIIDWDFIDKNLDDNEVLAVKPHPYGHDIFIGKHRHIIELPKMEPTVNYLYDCDVVITDYSSIIFDGYLLNKPAVLFEKNPGYTSTRGMYLKYPDEYCSRYATNEQGLLDTIRSADRLTIIEKNCIDYVADACDGYSCDRIIQLIKEMNSDG